MWFHLSQDDWIYSTVYSWCIDSELSDKYMYFAVKCPSVMATILWNFLMLNRPLKSCSTCMYVHPAAWNCLRVIMWYQQVLLLRHRSGTWGVVAVEHKPDQLDRGRGTHAGKRETTTVVGSGFDEETWEVCVGRLSLREKQVCEEVIRTLWWAQQRAHARACTQINTLLQISPAETIRSTSTWNWNGISSNNLACTAAVPNFFCSFAI